MNTKNASHFFLQRIALFFKSMGLLFFVPLVVVNIIIPILLYFTYAARGIGENLHTTFYQLNLIFIPISASFWPLILLQNLLGLESYEYLFCFRRRAYLAELFFLFMIMMLNVFLLFFLYNLLIDSVLTLYLKIFCVSFFYFGACLLLAQFSRSFSVVLMCLLSFTVANYVYATDHANFPLYYDLSSVHWHYLSREGIGFVVLGAVMTLGAWVCSLFFRSGN